jgi:hypothetical protein
LLAGQLATTKELKACQQPSKTLLGVASRNTVPGLFAYKYSSLPIFAARFISAISITRIQSMQLPLLRYF